MSLDIEAIKARATGGGFVTVCCHPDLSVDLQTDSFDRACVLDRGATEECDQSAKPHGTVADKTECPFWLPLQQTKPIGATPGETLELIAQNAALREALEVAMQTVREVSHAQENGARWYTDGATGLYQQIRRHVRRAFDAYAVLSPPTEGVKEDD